MAGGQYANKTTRIFPLPTVNAERKAKATNPRHRNVRCRSRSNHSLLLNSLNMWELSKQSLKAKYNMYKAIIQYNMYTPIDEQQEKEEDCDTYERDEYDEYRDDCIRELQNR
jgi:hypothetical protein